MVLQGLSVAQRHILKHPSLFSPLSLMTVVPQIMYLVEDKVLFVDVCGDSLKAQPPLCLHFS